MQTALAFAREGAVVAVNDLRAARAGATVRKIERAGGRALAVPGDAADAATAAAIVAAVAKRFRKIDILVNNAGVGVAGTVLTTSESDWDAHLHEHFVDPCVIRGARYQTPLRPGYSIEMKAESLWDYHFPAGPAWRRIH